jgi:hypothetical protein
VPTNRDRFTQVAPLSATDSGKKETFTSSQTSLTHDGTSGAEGWVALCAQAAVERDPKKLLELVSEINRLLDARRKRLTTKS